MENNQRNIVIGLAVIALLLVAIIGVMIFKQSSGVPEPDRQVPNSELPQPTPSGTGTAQPPTPVKPGEAVKLPKGTTPQKWVEEYYSACEKKDYATAVKRLPADTQAQTTPESLKQQLESYNVTDWNIVSTKPAGDTTTVVAEQVTGFGTFQSNWTFQKSGDTYVLVKKAVGGMSQ